MSQYCWYGEKRFNHFIGGATFSPCDTTYKVLLLPFTPYGCKLEDDAASKIQRRLVELNQDENLEMNSYCLPNYKPTENFTQDSAEYLRTLHNADLIVYGNYVKGKDQCESDNVDKFCMRFRGNNVEGKIEENGTSLSLLHNGELQGELEQLAFFVAIQKNIDRENYKKAIQQILFLKNNLEYDTAECNVQIAQCYDGLGREYEAIQYYSKAVSFKNVSVSYAAYINRGNIYRKQKKHKLALLDFSEAIKLQPSNAIAYCNRGSIYMDLKEYNLAKNDFNIAIKFAPTQALTNLNLGSLYAILKNYNLALKYYNKGIELNPNLAVLYLARSNVYSNLNKYNHALDDYNKAIELGMKTSEHYGNRAAIYKKLKKYNLALMDYHKSIQYDSNNTTTYFNRGNTYFDMKKYDSALVDYSRVIKINPKDTIAYLRRGRVYRDLQKYDLALKDINKSIEIDTNLAEAYADRGVIYGELNNHYKALESYDKAIKLDSKLIMAYTNRGVLYASLGKPNLAIEDYNMCISLSKNDALCYANRSRVREAMFDFTGACQDAKKAKSLGYKDKELDSLIKENCQ